MPESAAPKSQPFRSSIMQIEPQWIDYNGHLNMAYYNVMFDRAIDQMWLQLGIGPTYMKERHGSTFTAEAHVRYLREIHLGDPVQVSVWLLAADEKRLHTFEELRHATEGWLSARPGPLVAAADLPGHGCRGQGFRDQGRVRGRQPARL